jgi:hypothetical protein
MESAAGIVFDYIGTYDVRTINIKDFLWLFQYIGVNSYSEWDRLLLSQHFIPCVLLDLIWEACSEQFLVLSVLGYFLARLRHWEAFNS